MVMIVKMINLKWKETLSGAAARTGKVSKKKEQKDVRTRRIEGFYRNYKKSV